MTTPFYNPVENVELAEKTIIIPVVSTANVAQLAADLLISNLTLQHIGIFDPTFLIPAISGREDGRDGITTPLELYGKTDSNFLVVQQRSPVLKAFVDKLWDFIKRSRIECVLLLCGLDPTDRTDSQMLTPIYQLQPPNSPSLESSPLQALTKLSIPVYTPPFFRDDHNVLPFIPDGGLTRRILSSIPLDLPPTPVASLLQFVLEGDNRADAQHLAATVISTLGGDPSTILWIQPSSWKYGLFGAPHDQTLYG